MKYKIIVTILLLMFVGLNSLVSEDKKSTAIDVAASKKLIKTSEKIAKERKELIKKLLPIVSLEPLNEKQVKIKRKVIIELGILKADAVIPLLMPLLGSTITAKGAVEFELIGGGGQIYTTPAMKALVKFGPLGIKPLIKAYTKGVVTKAITFQVLGMLLEYRIMTVAVLSHELQGSKDDKVKKGLQWMIDRLDLK